jgi:undecaprenyl diphosphate synthase
MDGNGRWAERRGLSRTNGHRQGVEAVRRVVDASLTENVRILTLFAFSADNWQRPADEVAGLFNLISRYLAGEIRACQRRGVRVTVIGRRDRLPRALTSAITRAEEATAGGRRLWLRIAIDYSAREAILRAVRQLAWDGLRTTASLDSFGRLISNTREPAAWQPTAAEVDLVIRTGGERRLSDFLLWESAYAELHFTNSMWPDFGPEDLRAALHDFRGRDRRFGRLAAS